MNLHSAPFHIMTVQTHSIQTKTYHRSVLNIVFKYIFVFFTDSLIYLHACLFYLLVG